MERPARGREPGAAPTERGCRLDAVQRRTTNEALGRQLLPIQLATGRPEVARSTYRVLAARARLRPRRQADSGRGTLDLIGK
ncbi:hypothetical protein ACFVYE_13370 [Streptomyces sp. NPDC058239]|uniref:hypothetical protein n=1 Tax=unclassified Streptomyces TaxID=2593676 RepID=UPI00365F5C5F